MDDSHISRRRRRLETHDDSGAVLTSSHDEFTDLTLDCPLAVVALRSKSMFGVLQSNKVFSVIDPMTGLAARNFKLNTPQDLDQFQPTEMTSDGSGTIFCNTVVIKSEGQSHQRIYRFWLGENVSTELFLFAQSSSMNSYRGMAYSEYWSCLFTTEGENIIALSAASLPREETARKVFEVYFGPEPFVHAISHSCCTAANLICASKFHLVNKVITKKRDDFEVVKEQRWSDEGLDGLKTACPHLLSLWNARALISKGYWLKVFSNFPNDPVYIGAFEPPEGSESPFESCTALAALRYFDDVSNRTKDVALLLNQSNVVRLVMVPESTDDERFTN